MQTFMPYNDFARTAKSLDNKRLNKQALEAWQIMLTNLHLDPNNGHRPPRGWFNHPAAVMWRGHEQALLTYIEAMVEEWKGRGYKSTILDKATNTFVFAIENDLTMYEDDVIMPTWIENKLLLDKLTETHRLALLTKNYEWYSQFDWPEDHGFQPATYEYFWPGNN
jgi:hypothetical protein